MADIAFNPALIQKNLSGINYPASRDTLIKTAHSHRAPDEVHEWLNDLPEREYISPADVMHELSEQKSG